MSTPESASSTRPTDGPSRTEIVLGRTLWSVGAVVSALSVLLLVGACATDTAAGESWQPAGVLGMIGLLLGATILAVAVVARRVTRKPTHQ
ncbi:hypothetical protein [Streptomyces sp. TLI_146]|uniref:hypothetical protein n=1 Tax=Streptomyces sp. TLI_146 TaxID=1938858 RepID=UPI000C70F237|nr:hypothetical protein [Streptomyces sp. TLI_146]PKV90028.1 hypothetical protein BX283_7688 [Streptomyces sp. TLI_146]